MFRAKLSVEIWENGDLDKKTTVVEVILDDPFSVEKLPIVGAALQRGVYSALLEAIAIRTGKKYNG